MALIPAGALEGVNLLGAEPRCRDSRSSSTTASPAKGLGCTATPTTRPGWSRREPSTFQSGDLRSPVAAGDVVIVPPGAPHKFINDGPGRSKMICIHASPRLSDRVA